MKITLIEFQYFIFFGLTKMGSFLFESQTIKVISQCVCVKLIILFYSVVFFVLLLSQWVISNSTPSDDSLFNYVCVCVWIAIGTVNTDNKQQYCYLYCKSLFHKLMDIFRV